MELVWLIANSLAGAGLNQSSGFKLQEIGVKAWLQANLHIT